MNLLEFIDCLERYHPQNFAEEEVLIEVIGNFIAEDAKNPLSDKHSSLKKILNPNNPRPIPKKDADYIFCHRDIKRFEKYMDRYLKSERNRKFFEDQMERNGSTFNYDQMGKEALSRTFACEFENIIQEFRNRAQKREKKTASRVYRITDQDINSRIEKVVNALSELPVTKRAVIEPYDVRKIKEKLNFEENARLYEKVLRNVGDYFEIVKQLFAEKQKSPDVIYDAVKEKVHEHYLRLKGDSQKDVFGKMVEWLMNETFGDRESCEIVISYFIRTCEVFDAVTK